MPKMYVYNYFACQYSCTHLRKQKLVESDGVVKSTQRTNFQSIAYFAYLFMKLTLKYVKVVKYFPC